ISLDLQTGSTALGPDVREVVLTVTVSAKIGDVTIFLVEIKQAGLFVIRNLGDGDLKRAISTVCPGILFPYARAAVSQLVSQGGRPVRLWGRDRAQLAEIAASRRNERYLPSAGFPESLRVEPDLPRSLSGARDVLIVVPSHAFRPLLRLLAPQLAPEPHVVWATKGFEQGSLKLPHQIAREVLGAERRVAVLSGPTFAREVGAGLPTAMTVASPDASYARALAQELSSANFRAYTT